MFPIIPLACLAGLLGGAFGLNWYYRLSQEQQAAADEYAAELAERFYDKAVDELVQHEAENIGRLVRAKFG